MICLSVYLLLPFLPYIYFAVQSGGKKKKDTKRTRKKHSSKKDKKKEKKEKGKKEEKKEDEKKEEKKDEKKEGENKDEQKNEEGEKEGEKKGDEKDEEKEKEKEEELPLDVTMPSESKEEPPAPGGTKKGIMLSPSSLAWEPKASKQVFKVTNATEEKQAMKIKCSNNKIFRVNPVFAMIDVGKTINVVVFRSDGPVKPEKLLVLTTPFEGDSAKKAFANKDKINARIFTVPLVAKHK
ncbi:hypothetical protein V3C99_016478 [Haemonchus contortus]